MLLALSPWGPSGIYCPYEKPFNIVWPHHIGSDGIIVLHSALACRPANLFGISNDNRLTPEGLTGPEQLAQNESSRRFAKL